MSAGIPMRGGSAIGAVSGADFLIKRKLDADRALAFASLLGAGSRRPFRARSFRARFQPPYAAWQDRRAGAVPRRWWPSSIPAERHLRSESDDRRDQEATPWPALL